MTAYPSKCASSLHSELHGLLWATGALGALLVGLRPDDQAVRNRIGDTLDPFMVIVDAVDRDDPDGMRSGALRALEAVELLRASILATGIHAPALRLDLVSAVLRRFCDDRARIKSPRLTMPRRRGSRFEATC